jgi:hypothetical protein
MTRTGNKQQRRKTVRQKEIIEEEIKVTQTKQKGKTDLYSY